MQCLVAAEKVWDQLHGADQIKAAEEEGERAATEVEEGEETKTGINPPSDLKGHSDFRHQGFQGWKKQRFCPVTSDHRLQAPLRHTKVLTTCWFGLNLSFMIGKGAGTS